MFKARTCLLGGILVLWSALALAVQPLEIKAVIVDDTTDPVVLMVYGENFLNGSDLELWLGEDILLTIDPTSLTNTSVTATLPLGYFEGSYQIIAMTGGGTVRFDDFDGVTIGAVGPKGDEGAQGEQGPAGADGPPGPQGDVGPPGPPGANCFDGIGTTTADCIGSQGDQGLKGLPGAEGPPGANGLLRVYAVTGRNRPFNGDDDRTSITGVCDVGDIPLRADWTIGEISSGAFITGIDSTNNTYTISIRHFNAGSTANFYNFTYWCIDQFPQKPPHPEFDNSYWGNCTSVFGNWTCVPETEEPGNSDADGDGFAEDVDCDDTDLSVFPGQTSFFLTANVNVGFDYNCDGLIEQNPMLGLCTASGVTDCWQEPVPLCGQTGKRGDGQFVQVSCR